MHLKLRVGKSRDGKPVFEPVHVIPLGNSKYKIEFTPGLAYGIAAGDEFEFLEDGTYTVTSRAGNIAVRVLSKQSLRELAAALTAQVESLGGRLDGYIDRGLAYTIPLAVGFAAVERILNSFVLENPATVWEYGNVYGEDGSPLNWWQEVA